MQMAIVKLAYVSGSRTEITSTKASDKAYFGFLDALCKNKLARILAEQTVAVCDGSSASLSSGSTVGRRDVDNGLGEKFVGTKLNVAPEILEDNKVRIDICLKSSELAETGSTERPGNPAIRVREIDTELEVNLGETFMIAGCLGKVRNGEQFDETELVLLVTPQLAGEEPSDKQTVVRLGRANASSNATR